MIQEQHKFSIIGNSVHRVDGVDKVTGKAKYVADLIIPGMSEGKFLRSPYAHARIRSIDTTEAEAMPGVLYSWNERRKFLRSPYAHARIRSIDTTEAEAMPGVSR